MLRRILDLVGYRKPEDLADFLMTGAAVAPAVVFFGVGIGEAILVMLFCLLPSMLLLPWLQARAELEERLEAMRESERERRVRRLTGGR